MLLFSSLSKTNFQQEIFHDLVLSRFAGWCRVGFFTAHLTVQHYAFILGSVRLIAVPFRGKALLESNDSQYPRCRG